MKAEPDDMPPAPSLPSVPALRDRVCIVTGSSRGIGREIARVLLASGCRVVLNGRNREQLEETAAKLRQQQHSVSGQMTPVTADVSTEEGASLLIGRALEVYGRIDYLINNAGVSMRGSIRELRAATIENLYRGNILTAVLPTVAVLPELERTGGKVVFVSTGAALWGFPGVSIYSATKAAVEVFSQALDAEVRSSGVRSATVFLGFVENDPDKETLAADGTFFRHTRKAQQTQVQAATAIVRALTKNRRRVFTTPSGRVLALGARLAPSVISRFLRGRGNQFHRVERSE